MAEVFLVKLPSGDHHCTSLIICQCCSSYCLRAIRQEGIIWANVAMWPKNLHDSSAICPMVFTGLYLEQGMGGSPPILPAWPPNFGKSGGRSYLTKSYLAFVLNAPFSVDRAPLFWNIEGDFPLKIWNPALYILFKFFKSLIRHLGVVIGDVQLIRSFSWFMNTDVDPVLCQDMITRPQWVQLG